MIMLECFQLMEKICIKNMGVKQSFEKNENMFFLRKPSLVSFFLVFKCNFDDDSNCLEDLSPNEIYTWKVTDKTSLVKSVNQENKIQDGDTDKESDERQETQNVRGIKILPKPSSHEHL